MELRHRNNDRLETMKFRGDALDPKAEVVGVGQRTGAVRPDRSFRSRLCGGGDPGRAAGDLGLYRQHHKSVGLETGKVLAT